MRNISATSILKLMTVLLLAVLSTASLAQTFPSVVATAKLTNQTTTISSTVLFTPTTDGVFRINVYMVTTVPKTK